MMSDRKNRSLSPIFSMVAPGLSRFPTPSSSSDFGDGSLSFLFRRLWNPTLEEFWPFAGEGDRSPFRWDSIRLLSVDALDAVLCANGVIIESEDALFSLIVLLSTSPPRSME
jgi:hypothetical protein